MMLSVGGTIWYRDRSLLDAVASGYVVTKLVPGV